jgi:hypothetical protein
MLPKKDELAVLRHQMEQRIKSWKLPKSWETRVQVRIQVAGYATDREQIRQLTKQVFSAFSLFPDGEPRMDNLYHQPDPDKALIAARFQEWVEKLDWQIEESTDPDKSKILEEGLKVIYGDI